MLAWNDVCVFGSVRAGYAELISWRYGEDKGVEGNELCSPSSLEVIPGRGRGGESKGFESFSRLRGGESQRVSKASRG